MSSSNTPQVIDTNETTETVPSINPQKAEHYIRELIRAHGAKCRKKGFKDHIHRPAGSKLERKLRRQGSLYRKVSVVYETFLDIQSHKFKEKQAMLKLQCENTDL